MSSNIGKISAEGMRKISNRAMSSLFLSVGGARTVEAALIGPLLVFRRMQLSLDYLQKHN